MIKDIVSCNATTADLLSIPTLLFQTQGKFSSSKDVILYVCNIDYHCESMRTLIIYCISVLLKELGN